jgi:hypothetical protein
VTAAPIVGENNIGIRFSWRSLQGCDQTFGGCPGVFCCILVLPQSSLFNCHFAISASLPVLRGRISHLRYQKFQRPSGFIRRQSIANTTASDSLIVDDEADIRELVADILYDEGYGTRTARDSDEALSAVVAR